MQNLIQLVSEVLELGENEIGEDTSPDNTERWDSLASVRLMMALQEAYAVEFSTSEIMAMRSVALIRRVLRRKKIVFA